MIHEIAVDPALVASKGCEPEGFRELFRSFGLGETRVLAGFPSASAWRRGVLEGSQNGLARGRLEELCKRMTEVATFRRAAGDGGGPWDERAAIEHSRRPFHGILASGLRDHPAAIAWQEVMGPLPGRRPRWDFPRSLPLQRTELVRRLAPLLGVARRLVFVDPWFSPQSTGRVQLLGDLLTEVFRHRSPVEFPERMELHLHRDKAEPLGREAYAAACLRELLPLVPQGAQFLVRRISELPGGQKLHNRFLLSELGGLFIGKGIAPGGDSDQEDVGVLEREHSMALFQRHEALRDYDASEPPIVVR